MQISTHRVQAEWIVPGPQVLEQVRPPLCLSSPLMPIPPVSFPLFLSCLRVFKREASLIQGEQQDTPQETALEISLSYIYKVSQTAVSAPNLDLFNRLVRRVPSSTTAGTRWAASTDAMLRSHSPCHHLPPEDPTGPSLWPRHLFISALTQRGQGAQNATPPACLVSQEVHTALVLSLLSSS